MLENIYQVISPLGEIRKLNKHSKEERNIVFITIFKTKYLLGFLK